MNNLFVLVPGKELRQLNCRIVLDPAKKDVNRKAYQGSATDPFGLPFPEKAGEEGEEDKAREDEVDNEDQIPGKPMFKKGRKNHGAIRGEKIEQNVTDQN